MIGARIERWEECVMRPTVVIGVVAVAFAACLGLVTLRAQQGAAPNARTGGDDDQRIRNGFAFARDQGIPLDVRHRNRELVGLGAYLVNAAGGCNDCHTAPPFTQDPYAYLGAPKQINVPCYLAGGTPFGPFVSRDITPWEDGKPAGLTFRQFLHVMRTGEDPDHPGQLLQVMPWPVYQTLTEGDLRAIYEFLSAIPAVPANTCGVPSEQPQH
jgi:hypothetical protein